MRGLLLRVGWTFHEGQAAKVGMGVDNRRTYLGLGLRPWTTAFREVKHGTAKTSQAHQHPRHLRQEWRSLHGSLEERSDFLH